MVCMRGRYKKRVGERFHLRCFSGYPIRRGWLALRLGCDSTRMSYLHGNNVTKMVNRMDNQRRNSLNPNQLISEIEPRLAFMYPDPHSDRTSTNVCGR